MKNKASIIAIILSVTINFASCASQSCPVSQDMDTGYELNDLYNYFGRIPYQEEISRGSTAADVALIDPGMEMNFVESTGPSSYHILEDDQILRIKYLYPVSSEMLSRNNLIVLSMDVLSPNTTSNPFCKCQFAVEVIKHNP